MIYKYSRDEMKVFYDIYSNEDTSNAIPFTDKLREYDVPFKDSLLMWQSFDIVTELFICG